MVIYHSKNMAGKEVTPKFALGSLLLTRFREGLAGKSRTENVMLGDRCFANLPKITGGTEAKIPLIQIAERFVDLAGKNAAMSKLAKR